MGVTQATHQIPVENMDVPLVKSGANNAIAHITSNEFVFKALQDGVVDAVLPNKRARLKYKDGSVDYISLEQINTRSRDGFYVNINMELDKKVKKGMKFKANDILAADRHFFNIDGNDTSLFHGTFAKVAITTMNNSYEDSSVISQKIADKMTTSITMMTVVSLGKGDNIEKLIKIGTPVNTNDPLVVFEKALEADTSTMELLSKLGDELQEEIEKGGKNALLSKYTGIVTDIRVHRNYEVEEYSPSLKKMITEYDKKYKAEANAVADIRDDRFLPFHFVGINETGRSRSEQFDGVLIEFMITIKDKMKPGDKMSLSLALKNIAAETIVYGEEPYTNHRPEDTIDFILSPMSLVSRQVPDQHMQMFTNKVMYELNMQVKELAKKG